MKEHIFKIERKFYDLIASGQKKYEIRIHKGKFEKVEWGDIIIFYPKEEEEGDCVLKRKVVTSYRYCGLKDMPKNQIKGLGFKDLDDLIGTMHDIYYREKVIEFGFIVFELENLGENK